jgi:hypothetical protein
VDGGQSTFNGRNNILLSGATTTAINRNATYRCVTQDCSQHMSFRLCGLVIRVPGYTSRDPGFDSRRYHISWEVMGLERGPLSLVSITEELLEWKSIDYVSRKPRLTTTRHSPFAYKRRSLGRYTSLADWSFNDKLSYLKAVVMRHKKLFAKLNAGKNLLLEAAIKQRFVKSENTLCLL